MQGLGFRVYLSPHLATVLWATGRVLGQAFRLRILVAWGSGFRVLCLQSWSWEPRYIQHASSEIQPETNGLRVLGLGFRRVGFRFRVHLSAVVSPVSQACPKHNVNNPTLSLLHVFIENA